MEKCVCVTYSKELMTVKESDIQGGTGMICNAVKQNTDHELIINIEETQVTHTQQHHAQSPELILQYTLPPARVTVAL